jgi:hypothetical protein
LPLFKLPFGRLPSLYYWVDPSLPAALALVVTFFFLSTGALDSHKGVVFFRQRNLFLDLRWFFPFSRRKTYSPFHKKLSRFIRNLVVTSYVSRYVSKYVMFWLGIRLEVVDHTSSPFALPECPSPLPF